MFSKLSIKGLKIVGIVLGSLLTLLVIFSVVVNIFFKEQLVQYLIEQLNKQINARIDVQQSDFTFWKTFPYASIEFEDVVLRPSNDWIKQHGAEKDTLLFGDNVTFQFNVIKLLHNNIVLNKIKLTNGGIHLVVDRSGNLNYDIFKKGEGEGARLSLRSIVLKKCTIDYSNLKSDVYISTYTSKSSLSGTIRSKTFDFKVTTDMLIHKIMVGSAVYIKERSFSSKCALYISNSTYNFNNVSFSIDNLNFLFNGKYIAGDVDYMDFKIGGDQVSLNELMNFLPDAYKSTLSSYTAKGLLNLDVAIKGKVGSRYNPQLTIAYSSFNSTVTESKSHIRLENLSFSGTFTNGSNRSKQTSEFKIDNFSSKLGFGELSFKGEIRNLNEPSVYMDGSTKLELNTVKEFFKLDTFDVLKGKMEGTFSTVFTVSGFQTQQSSRIHVKELSGEATLKDAALKLRKSDYYLSNINGLIALDTNIYFKDISLKLNDYDVRLKGRLVNGLPFLLKRTEDATIEAELFSPYIDLSRYFTANGRKSTSSRAMLFPPHLNLDIKLNINEFVVNKFKAKRVRGNLQYKPTMFILKSLSFETMDGNLKGNGVIVQDINKHFMMKGQVDVSKVNIQKAFHTFNNFSQTIVRDTHLRGRLSGKVEFTSEWNANLAFIPEKLAVNADVVIANGELLNFEPMNGLSRFISLDELKNIRFSTLHNTIYIHDKQIIIPEMEIKSSAFNISGSGIHHFDNHYQYKLKVLLSEVLYGKAKRAKKENEEYGRIEDDGLGRTSIYLTVEGFGKDYKIAYDSKKTIDIIKESFVKQKLELKEIFRDEFGWFKKDSTVKSNKKPISNAVQVQFDDDPSEEKPITAPQPTSQPTKKKTEPAEKVEVEWE